jgi:hypothetical protein
LGAPRRTEGSVLNDQQPALQRNVAQLGELSGAYTNQVAVIARWLRQHLDDIPQCRRLWLMQAAGHVWRNRTQARIRLPSQHELQVASRNITWCEDTYGRPGDRKIDADLVRREHRAMCGIRCLHALQRHHPRRVRPLAKALPTDHRTANGNAQTRICRRHQTLDAR